MNTNPGTIYTPAHSGRKTVTSIAAAVVAAALVMILLPEFRVYELTLSVIWAIGTVGVNILTGFTGQISLANNAFFAFGAYFPVVVYQETGIQPLYLLPATAIICAVLGAIIGLPAARVKGLYLAVLTLGVALLIPAIIEKLSRFTGGADGLSVPALAVPSFLSVGSGSYLFVVVVAIGVGCLLAARLVVRGPEGVRMRTVRDHEILAESCGINVSSVKMRAFALSGAYAGVAGCLYGMTVGFISPGSFDVFLGIQFLVASVVGGLGTIVGAIWGGIFIGLAPNLVGSLNPALSGLLYAFALAFTVFVFPNGIQEGLVRAVRLILEVMRNLRTHLQAR